MKYKVVYINECTWATGIMLTIIICYSYFSGSTSSKALSITNSSLETATVTQSNILHKTVVRNIMYLSNQCKYLFKFMNIIIRNIEKCWNSIGLGARGCGSRNSDNDRICVEISTLRGEKGVNSLCWPWNQFPEHKCAE